MLEKPTVKQITIYPIKSLDGISVKKATIQQGGSLQNDREYAMLDQDGKYISGKTNPKIHLLRSRFFLEEDIVQFNHPGNTSWQSFHLRNEVAAIENYLTSYFGITVNFKRNTTGRFLDEPDIGGATLLSSASLQLVEQWFPTISTPEMRNRFRATIEIEGVPPFWEDHLFSNPGKKISFSIGNVQLMGVSPRERCIVPTRNPETGESTFAFAKIFAHQRETTLPPWSVLNQYNHFYFLSVDCQFLPAEIGKQIHTGDELTVLGEV